MAADFILTHELKPYIRYADQLEYMHWETPRRIITDYLLLYVCEGALDLKMEDKTHVVQKGQFSFVQPGIVHQLESLAPVTVLAMHVDLFPNAVGADAPPLLVSVEPGQVPVVEFMQPSFDKFADISVPLIIKPDKPDWMVESLQRVITLWSRKNAIDLLQAHVCATEIMIAILRKYTVQSTGDRKSSTDLSWVPAYMQYRLSESLSVEEMARKAFMSRSYFSQHFHAQFGRAPHQYLLRLRLDYAADLLKSTNIPLKDITVRCGFSSVHHLSKMFKLSFGCPPSQFRLRL